LLHSDLDIQLLAQKYDDLLEYDDIATLRRKSLESIVRNLANNLNFETIFIISARISAAKPHTANVERLINANYIWKTSLRNHSLITETENVYLSIHVYMPPLEERGGRGDVDLPLFLQKRNQDWYNHVFPKDKS